MIGAVTVAAVVGLALSGCDQFLPEPLSFTMVDGEPVVRVCLPVTITEVAINAYPDTEDGEFSTAVEVWRAGGNASVGAGHEFILGRTFDDLSVLVGDEVLSELPGLPFSVEIRVSSERGGSWTTFSYFETELREGAWVDSYGQEQAVPCTRPDCKPGWACHNEWPEPDGEPTRPEPTIVPPQSD
ncbi:MAG: hypothetical protein U1E32_10305 [Rhodoglobus sp.]|nr:hypothetical protein [Rhodoglobus sp.]